MPDAYVKQTWVDGVAGATPISAARLAHIEDGIENATVPDGTYVEPISAAVTVTVGTGGDHATISEALAALSKKKAAFVNGGFSATISLLTGFVMAEQIMIENVDLGWAQITSVDAEVTVARSTIPSGQGAWYAVRNAVLPKIDCFFRMDSSGSGTAHRMFDIMRNSSIEFGANGGGGGAVNRVLQVIHGSRCTATAGVRISDSLDIGIRCANASVMSIPASTITNNANNGIAVSGAIVQMANSTCTGSATNIVGTGISIIEATNCDLSGSLPGGVAVSASMCWAYVTGSDLTDGGLTAGAGSIVDARTCTFAAGDVITVAEGGEANITGRTGGTLSQTANLLTAAGIIRDTAEAAQSFRTDSDPLRLPPGVFDAVVGAPTKGLIGSRISVWLLDAATDEHISTIVAGGVPSTWTTFHVDVIWTNMGAGAGDVALRLGRANIIAGVDLNGFTITTDATVVVTASAQNIRAQTRLATGLTRVASTDLFLRPFRAASAASDTLANDIGVLGVVLTKAS